MTSLCPLTFLRLCRDHLRNLTSCETGEPHPQGMLAEPRTYLAKWVCSPLDRVNADSWSFHFAIRSRSQRRGRAQETTPLAREEMKTVSEIGVSLECETPHSGLGLFPHAEEAPRMPSTVLFNSRSQFWLHLNGRSNTSSSPTI